MLSSGAGAGGYSVHNSSGNWSGLPSIKRQATREGRGKDLLDAARIVRDRLRSDPGEFGEPLYRLPTLRMQFRCAAVRPLYVDFAVCEDRPLVFIKAVKLLAR